MFGGLCQLRGADGSGLQRRLEKLELQIVVERELDRDLSVDRGRRHPLQGRGPVDVADPALRFDLRSSAFHS